MVRIVTLHSSLHDQPRARTEIKPQTQKPRCECVLPGYSCYTSWGVVTDESGAMVEWGLVGVNQARIKSCSNVNLSPMNLIWSHLEPNPREVTVMTETTIISSTALGKVHTWHEEWVYYTQIAALQCCLRMLFPLQRLHGAKWLLTCCVKKKCSNARGVASYPDTQLCGRDWRFQTASTWECW